MLMKQVYELDESGFLKEIHVTEIDNQGNVIDKLFSHLIIVDPPNGLYKPKWDGTEWIEGATEEEIAKLTKVEPSPPTEIELLKERLIIAENTILDLILGGL